MKFDGALRCVLIMKISAVKSESCILPASRGSPVRWLGIVMNLPTNQLPQTLKDFDVPPSPTGIVELCQTSSGELLGFA